jgi:hypothetical protein
MVAVAQPGHGRDLSDGKVVLLVQLAQAWPLEYLRAGTRYGQAIGQRRWRADIGDLAVQPDVFGGRPKRFRRLVDGVGRGQDGGNVVPVEGGRVGAGP